MRYGFKAQAERVSSDFREQSGISAVDPLEPISFLRKQDIFVWTPNDIPGVPASTLNQLMEIDPDSWSGLTVRESGKTAVVLNPTHPLGRQANMLMHEWAHLFLKHEPKRVDITPDGVLLISDYAKDDEDEADWLAGAMLVPREGLFKLLQGGQSSNEIAATYKVSIDLTQWRIRMTGVLKQLQARSRW